MQGLRRNAVTYTAEVVFAALSYTLLFMLNEQLNPIFWERPGVSWLFLPAGVRLLLVLLCGWPAALGLVVGGWLTGSWMLAEHAGLVPVFGLVNGLTPLAALWVARRGFNVRSGLGNLTPLNLVGLSLLFAAVNVVLLQGFYLAAGLVLPEALPSAMFAMFFGDVTGALVVLVATSMVLRGYRRVRKELPWA